LIRYDYLRPLSLFLISDVLKRYLFVRCISKLRRKVGVWIASSDKMERLPILLLDLFRYFDHPGIMLTQMLGHAPYNLRCGPLGAVMSEDLAALFR